MIINLLAHLPLLTALASPECLTPNGRFAAGDQCDAYTECQDDVPVLKLCPDGIVPLSIMLIIYLISVLSVNRSALPSAHQGDR